MPSSIVLPLPKGSTYPSHVVKTFLEAGCPVRGTVRSKEKGEYLSNLFKDSKTPFEYVIVEDIAEVRRHGDGADGSLVPSTRRSRELLVLRTLLGECSS